MIEEEPQPTGLAFTASLYQTLNTRVVFGAAGTQLLLPANARRLYLSVERITAAGVFHMLLPGPVPAGIVPVQNSSFRIEWKWRDGPSIVAGEWYALISGACTFVTTECLYLRG